MPRKYPVFLYEMYSAMGRGGVDACMRALTRVRSTVAPNRTHGSASRTPVTMAAEQKAQRRVVGRGPESKRNREGKRGFKS